MNQKHTPKAPHLSASDPPIWPIPDPQPTNEPTNHHVECDRVDQLPWTFPYAPPEV